MQLDWAWSPPPSRLEPWQRDWDSTQRGRFHFIVTSVSQYSEKHWADKVPMQRGLATEGKNPVHLFHVSGLKWYFYYTGERAAGISGNSVYRCFELRIRKIIPVGCYAQQENRKVRRYSFFKWGKEIPNNKNIFQTSYMWDGHLIKNETGVYYSLLTRLRIMMW